MKLFALIAFLIVSTSAFAEEFDKAKFQKVCEAMLKGDGVCAKVEAAKGKRKACVKEHIDQASAECKAYLESVK